MASAETHWVDNHCHLPDDDAEQVLAHATSAGVAKLIDVGCDLATSAACVARAQSHENVFATVGLHPHEAKHGLEGLESLLHEPGVVAVGECGLDYHYDHSPRGQQRDMFARQIGLAHSHQLPLVIHTREAWEETFEILDREGVPQRTIFHCFTGGPGEAAAAVDRDAFVSFSGIVTFKSAKDVQAAAVDVPLNRLLVETDSPYLAPVPHRGQPNQPAWVAVVGSALAELRGIAVLDVAQATWDNSHQAYPRIADSG